MVDTTHIFNITSYMKYATIPASLILLMLALLQRRSKPNPCGFHIPGIVVPMRFLDGYEDHWSYALAFGSVTGIIISVFIQQAFLPTTTDGKQTAVSDHFFCDPMAQNGTSLCGAVWAQTLQLQAQSLIASLVCAPPFVCLSTPYKLLGASLGFLYSIYWVVFYIVGAVNSEKYQDRTTGTLALLRDLPVFLCFMGLCARSVWSIILCYKTRTFRVEKVDKLVEKHQVDHVIGLFRPQPTVEPAAPEGLVESVKEKAKAQLFPHFRLPTRIICIAFVQIILIYYMGVTLSSLGVVLQRELKSVMGAFSDPNNTIFGDNTVSIFDGVYTTSVVLGLLSSVVYVTLFVVNYRINMINIYKGNKQSYMDLSHISTSQQVASSLRLPGYQIAYTLWGFVIITFMAFLVLFILCFGIYILIEADALGDVLKSFAQSLSVPLATILIFYLQVLLVRWYLLQPKLKEDDRRHPLNVDNRHVYEAVAYTLVFFNLLVGLASVLFRTLKSFLLGLIFLARLDRCLLMKGFESMDPGYLAYVGTLLVDNAHNNPVMRTFCAILVRLRCAPDLKEKKGIGHLLEPAKEGSNSRAARRWHLGYTLLKNPDLLPRRKLALLLVQSPYADTNSGHYNGAYAEDDKATATTASHSHSRSVKPMSSLSCSSEVSSDDAEGSVSVVRNAAGGMRGFREGDQREISLQKVTEIV